MKRPKGAAGFSATLLPPPPPPPSPTESPQLHEGSQQQPTTNAANATEQHGGAAKVLSAAAKSIALERQRLKTSTGGADAWRHVHLHSNDDGSLQHQILKQQRPPGGRKSKLFGVQHDIKQPLAQAHAPKVLPGPQQQQLKAAAHEQNQSLPKVQSSGQRALLVTRSHVMDQPGRLARPFAHRASSRIYAVMLPSSPFLARLCSGGTTLSTEGSLQASCQPCITASQQGPSDPPMHITPCCCGKLFHTKQDLLGDCPEVAPEQEDDIAATSVAPHASAASVAGCEVSRERLHAVVFVDMNDCGTGAADNPSWPLPHPLRPE